MFALLVWLGGTIGTILVQEVYQAILLAGFGTTSIVAALHTAQPPAETYIQPEITQVAVTRDVEDVVSTATPIPSTQMSAETDRRVGSPVDQVSCPNTPVPQLVVNLPALKVGRFNNNIRVSPSITARKIAVIRPGEKVEILSEPQCFDQYFWYKVRTRNQDEGWMAEADPTLQWYWLVPVFDSSECDLRPRFVPGNVIVMIDRIPNNVRRLPSRESDASSKDIYTGQTVVVLAGPVCSDDHIWYWVKNSDLGVEGWTAEGADGDYWFRKLDG